MKSKPCRNCGSEWHTAWKCPLLPKATLRTLKPMARIGRVGKQTESYVDKWKRKQKPDHQGYYTCYISGIKIPYLMAEHPYSKTRHPDKRTNQKLEPVCETLNALKGSMDIHDFLEKYPDFKATVKKGYLK